MSDDYMFTNPTRSHEIIVKYIQIVVSWLHMDVKLSNATREETVRNVA